MFSQIDNSHKKEQPQAEDKSVQNEINILNQNKINILNQDEIQPMGNEAANDQFKEYYTNMLREANEDNMLDLSGYEGAEENSIIGEKSSPNNIIHNKPNQIEKSLDESDDSIDLSNSMYLNSSHNIVNEEALERRLQNKQKNKLKKGKEKSNQADIPDQANIKDAFENADEIAEEQPQVKDTEHEIEQYGGISILGVVNPSVEVYLPEASKANGCAVILCPGGGLRALSWTSDVKEMAKLLNDNGYAAIGLKYHLNTGTMQMPKGMKMPPMVDVTGFANFKDADCNPAHFPQGDSILALAAALSSSEAS